MDNRDIKTGYDNTGSQTGLTDEERSSGEIPVPLHPKKKARTGFASRAVDPLSVLARFAERMSASVESDYGDWMREANAAWWEAAPVIARVPVAEVRDRFAALHELIQFNPNWKPIETCRRALEDVIEMRRALGAKDGRDLHAYDLGFTERETPLVFVEEILPLLPKRHAESKLPS